MSVEDTTNGLMSASEFRARYGVGVTKFYELINSGQLAARKLGAKTMIEQRAADEWVKSLPEYRGEKSAAA